MERIPIKFYERRHLTPGNRLELLGLPGDCGLGGESLDGGGSKKAVDSLSVAEDVLRILGLADGAAVAQDDDVLSHFPRCIGHVLNPGGAVLELQRAPGPDRALR